jgi:hypothetical protein
MMTQGLNNSINAKTKNTKLRDHLASILRTRDVNGSNFAFTISSTMCSRRIRSGAEQIMTGCGFGNGYI